MYNYDDCLCDKKEYGKFYKRKYAQAYIVPQVYENLFSIKEAFRKGTIFKDLYDEYYENEKKSCKSCRY